MLSPSFEPLASPDAVDQSPRRGSINGLLAKLLNDHPATAPCPDAITKIFVQRRELLTGRLHLLLKTILNVIKGLRVVQRANPSALRLLQRLRSRLKLLARTCLVECADPYRRKKRPSPLIGEGPVCRAESHSAEWAALMKWSVLLWGWWLRRSR